MKTTYIAPLAEAINLTAEKFICVSTSNGVSSNVGNPFSGNVPSDEEDW